MRLLNGLELPTAGEVIVNKQNILALKNKELRAFRKNIGMIFQHFNLLWSRTVIENIELPLELAGLGKAERKQKAEDLLQLVGLQEEAMPIHRNYPVGKSNGSESPERWQTIRRFYCVMKQQVP